jgi:hypothetical protein
MIRNGLYHITVQMLDGVQGGNQGGVSLAGKQSIRFKMKARLLIPD